MATKGKDNSHPGDLTPTEKLALIESLLWERITDPGVNAQTIVWASRELRNVISDREALTPTVTPKIAQLQALKRGT